MLLTSSEEHRGTHKIRLTFIRLKLFKKKKKLESIKQLFTTELVAKTIKIKNIEASIFLGDQLV